MMQEVKIGLFGIGLQTYWDQFEGLESRLSGYISVVEKKLTALCTVVNLGMVDTVDKAFEAGSRFRREEVDLIFLYATTYALSSTVLPVVSKSKIPVVVLNLAPDAAIDYSAFNRLKDRETMTGEWLAHCSACSVPEIASVFKRSGIPFHQVTGMLHNDPLAWEQIGDWIAAARVARVMYYNRLGVMGNYYGGMLDIYTNMTLQCARFGGHIEVIEVDELSALRKLVSDSAVEAKIKTMRENMDVQTDCSDADLAAAARTAAALDQLVKKYKLGSLAYYHKGSGNPLNEETMRSIIVGCSLLTSAGIPAAGEYEIKNAQAMKILSAFGAGGSFSEYYAMDYQDDVVLMGHDGPCHPAIAEGQIKVKPLRIYHGKVGGGLSVEMTVKHGPATLLSVIETIDGQLKFLVAEADSVPGPILEIGNTNSRYRFNIPARDFAERWNEQGPAHHCAIGLGHIAGKIRKLGELLDIETIRVC